MFKHLNLEFWSVFTLEDIIRKRKISVPQNIKKLLKIKSNKKTSFSSNKKKLSSITQIKENSNPYLFSKYVQTADLINHLKTLKKKKNQLKTFPKRLKIQHSSMDIMICLKKKKSILWNKISSLNKMITKIKC